MFRRRSCVLTVIGGLLVLVVLASVVALLLETNPPVVQEPNWDSPETRTLAKAACFDCHSNETNWPIWTRLPPGSWLAVYDTVRGRREMNWSEWGTARRGGESGERREGGREGGDDIAELINNGEMPPRNYLLLHPEAVLDAQQKQALIAGLEASLR